MFKIDCQKSIAKNIMFTCVIVADNFVLIIGFVF